MNQSNLQRVLVTELGEKLTRRHNVSGDLVRRLAVELGLSVTRTRYALQLGVAVEQHDYEMRHPQTAESEHDRLYREACTLVANTEDKELIEHVCQEPTAESVDFLREFIDNRRV